MTFLNKKYWTRIRCARIICVLASVLVDLRFVDVLSVFFKLIKNSFWGRDGCRWWLLQWLGVLHISLGISYKALWHGLNKQTSAPSGSDHVNFWIRFFKLIWSVPGCCIFHYYASLIWLQNWVYYFNWRNYSKHLPDNWQSHAKDFNMCLFS